MLTQSSERTLVGICAIVAFVIVATVDLVSGGVSSDSLAEWLRHVGKHGGIGTVLASFMAAGVASVRKSGLSLRNLMPIVVAVAACGLLVWFAVREEGTFREFGEMARPLSATTVQRWNERSMDETLPLEERARWSALYARERFLGDGSAVEMVTPQGQHRLFEPTDDDCNRREKLLSVRRFVEKGYADTLRALLVWPLIAFISAGVGLLWPRASLHSNVEEKSPPNITARRH